jgi:hypothetical protein
MKQLNIESTKTMNKLVGMVEDGYVKIDNSDGAFMSVHVEVFHEDEKSKIVSLVHYFLQNGDLIRHAGQFDHLPPFFENNP